MSTQKTFVTLEFSSADESLDSMPELQRITFFHALLPKAIVGVRGKVDLPQSATVSFQWSSGVRALALFFVNALLQEKELICATPVLEGIGGSAAATLDYALSRQSNWLLDLFGSDKQGLSTCRRFITRTNPERKRPGPVKLFLNTVVLNPQSISIRWNDWDCNTTQLLRTLSAKLSGGWNSAASLKPVLEVNDLPSERQALPPQFSEIDNFFPSPFDKGVCRTVLARIFQSELKEVLDRGKLFTESGNRAAVSRLFDDKTFIHFAGKNPIFAQSLDTSRSARERLGLSTSDFHRSLRGKNGEPLVVSLPGGYVAGVALLRYLRDIKRYPIELNYSFVHAGEVLDFQQRNEQQKTQSVAIVGDGHLSEFLSTKKASADYTGLMLMPDLSFQIVSNSPEKSNGAPIDEGCFHVLGEGKTSSLLYFNRLVHRGSIRKSGVKLKSALPDEISSLIVDGSSEMKAIQWFPYYRLQALSHGCSLLAAENDEMRYRPNVMLCHKDFLTQSDKRIALQSAILDAWLTLSQCPEALDSIINLITEDAAYLRFLARTAGFQHISADALLERFICADLQSTSPPAPKLQLIASGLAKW